MEMSVHNAQEYRKKMMFYEGVDTWHIERITNKGWRLVAGGFTCGEAMFIIKNGAGDIVKDEMNKATIIYIVVVIAVLIGLAIDNF